MSSLDPFQRQALVCAYWHRLMSTDQIRRLVTPAKPLRTVQHRLRALRRAGLVDCLDRHHAPRIWFTTADGATIVEASGIVDPRPYRVSGAGTARLLGEHALDVVETGLAFVETARQHGHECGPMSWTSEVAHRYLDYQAGPGHRNSVIADAVLHYVLVEPSGRRSQRVFFIELDRATMPVARLAQKLRNYVRYHDYIPHQATSGRPAWEERYPRFPRVLVVLSGAGEHVLDRRISDLRAQIHAMSTVALAGDRVHLLAVTLGRLRQDGPLAPIAIPLVGPDFTPLSPFSLPTVSTP